MKRQGSLQGTPRDVEGSSALEGAVDWLDRPAGPALRHRVRRTRFGVHELALRRDCRGAFRRMELNLGAAQMGPMAAALEPLGDLRTIVPGMLQVCEIRQLARVVLTPSRVDATLREGAAMDRVRALVMTMLGALERDIEQEIGGTKSCPRRTTF